MYLIVLDGMPFLPHICSFVKLRDRWTNQNIYHFNTHLAYTGMIARRESVHLILSRVQQIAGLMTPTIITGDFNANPQSDVYQIMITNTFFQDSMHATKTPHLGPYGTVCNFDVRLDIGPRLDYIFTQSQYFSVLQHAHLNYSENMYYPSDHLPVLTVLRFTNQTGLY